LNALCAQRGAANSKRGSLFFAFVARAATQFLYLSLVAAEMVFGRCKEQHGTSTSFGNLEQLFFKCLVFTVFSTLTQMGEFTFGSSSRLSWNFLMTKKMLKFLSLEKSPFLLAGSSQMPIY